MKKRRSSTSVEETEYFDRIPVDLFINIFSRLPLKSKAQCRCVSKLWSSIIRRPNYNQLFPIKPPASPRLLFAVEVAGELFFYSTPQPRNPDENTSLVATLHHRTCGTNFKICRPLVGGLVCRQHFLNNPSSVAVISNPITGEFLTLPKLSMDLVVAGCLKIDERYSFGYDPIDKQFKILCITGSYHLHSEKSFIQYQLLTLGTENKNLLWRSIHCCTDHDLLGDANSICISGVLYYPAVICKSTNRCCAIACFDVKSENFSFITDIDQDMSVKMTSFSFTLINYKGKLGACGCDINGYVLELWVLEDAKTSKWSKHIYQMPHPWLNEKNLVRAAGMSGSGEIVFYPRKRQIPFFIYYFNLESNILTRVRLKVPKFEVFSGYRVHTFTNYIQDMKLML